MEFPRFPYDQRMLTIWSLVPLPFLNPACTPESSTYQVFILTSSIFFPKLISKHPIWEMEFPSVTWSSKVKESAWISFSLEQKNGDFIKSAINKKHGYSTKKILVQCSWITKELIKENTRLKFPSLKLRRRQWQPTPVLLPGKSHGRRRLVVCSPWGR